MAHLGKTNNIFVLYPSFAGGNHLCNLISLCDGVEPTWLPAEELLARYEHRIKYIDEGTDEGGLIAHYNNTKNNEANLERIVNYRDFLLDQQETHINLIQGHHFSYKNFLYYRHSYLEGFKNVKWLMIECPKEGSLGRQRMDIEKRGIDLLEDQESTYPELVDTYTWDMKYLADERVPFATIEKLTEMFNVCPGTNGISIDSDIYFSYDGSKYLRTMLKGYFGLELPKIADRIHKMWIDMIEYRVTYDLLYNE